MMTGIELIEKEREEQLNKHGRSIELDAMDNDDCELADAAIAILLANIDEFPEKWNRKTCRKMSQKSYEDRLVIAGAFIAAERDRLEYMKTSKKIVSAHDDLPF